MPDVKLVNISKRYGKGKIIAADKVNLEIKDGEYFTILGPSGCGKSTLLKIIAGIVKPDEGEVYVGGKLINDVPIEERRIAMVFQNILLFPHMNVEENIGFAPRVKGIEKERRVRIVEEIVAMLKLTLRSTAFPDELSRGAQQKVSLARAIASETNLFLFDEPLSALDSRVRLELRYELRRLVKELGVTAIHVTHDQEEAMSISDRIAIMKRGRIIEVGSPVELYLGPRTIFTAHFLGKMNFMEGTAKELLNGECVVELAGGIKIKTRVKNKFTRERVVLAIRPEFIKISQTINNKYSNIIEGKIVEKFYTGSYIYYKLKLENGVEVFSLTEAEKTYKAGDKIYASFPPEYIILFKYPEEGLEKELSLE
jgi:ABC-type Fe3+/spermidine/putrescine transport system ATPase subunit